MKQVFFIMLFTGMIIRGYCQDDSGKNTISRLTTFSENQVTDKLYVQFDKPYYAVGDTIWFKAYLLNNFLLPSAKSGVLNIDIATDSNKVVKQYRFPVRAGLTWGNISLGGVDFKPGTYVLRAYTNWMRNFGDEQFFYKTINVSSASTGQLLVNAAFGNLTTSGADAIRAKLLFNTIAGLPYSVQPVTLQVVNDGKHLYQQKYQTGVDGGLDVNFNPPTKTGHLNLIAENAKKERLAVIPVTLNRSQNADVQFFPEGGRLVAGLSARIGFKAIGEDGKGLDVSGVILNQDQKQVVVFKSAHKGIGSFDLDIKEGETYMAHITLPGGVEKQLLLPAVKPAGTTLWVKNEIAKDSLEVTVAGNNIATSGTGYFLIGRARGIVCYAAVVNFHESNSVSKKIAKSLFPTGITHFTLMTTAYQPVNERLVYIDRHDDLKIKSSAIQPVYGKRDSVGLILKVTDADGNPVRGSFSMAVTDDAQVKQDTLDAENISTRFLLSADLKGYVEQPGYYLFAKTSEAWAALDNLLLTQGWVGYDWAQVLDPPSLSFQPEHEFGVSGQVVNVLNKPVKGTNVLLFSKSPMILMDTLTDNNGKFIFNRFPKVDTPVFILKAVNKRGKSFNVGVKVDDIAPPVFKARPMGPTIPWYVNIDSSLVNYAKNAAIMQQQQSYLASGHVLKEVKITAKKIIKGSQNLNGPGNADFVMDEKDLEAEGKKTWLQVLEERIGGFKERYGRVKTPAWNFIQDIKLPPDPDRPPPAGTGLAHWYFIHDKPIKIYVDGISITELHPAPDNGDPYDNMSGFLTGTTAEDIKGIELNFTDKYSGTYLAHFSSDYNIDMDEIAFIEITTRSGHGPITDNTPGMYLYKPLQLSWPKQFYKPKYAVQDTAKNRIDLRSTIDWEPNIVTDANGEAKIWFYTADKPSTYTMIIEGTDLTGHLGHTEEKIKVEVGKSN